ncbi:MAG: hypothetical protein QXS10_06400 [Candidatus Bathyarchaeia archaeon]
MANKAENKATIEANGDGLELADPSNESMLAIGAPAGINGPLKEASSASPIGEKHLLNKDIQKMNVNNRGRLLVALVLYSIFYGAFVVNLIDLRFPLEGWFHVFFGVIYFCPSLIVLIVLGFRGWRLALALGLLTSLMNDLFYAPRRTLCPCRVMI